MAVRHGRYSYGLSALKAQKSHTCVPCVLMTRSRFPAPTRTATPQRGGTRCLLPIRRHRRPRPLSGMRSGRRKHAVCKTSPSLSLLTAGSGSPAGVLTHPSAPVFTNVPAFSSRKASWSSARLFMTIGPCHATAHERSTRNQQKTNPHFADVTSTSSPAPKTTSVRFPDWSRIFSSSPANSFSTFTPNGAEAFQNWRCPRKYRRNPGGVSRETFWSCSAATRHRDRTDRCRCRRQPPISAIIAGDDADMRSVVVRQGIDVTGLDVLIARGAHLLVARQVRP